MVNESVHVSSEDMNAFLGVEVGTRALSVSWDNLAGMWIIAIEEVCRECGRIIFDSEAAVSGVCRECQREGAAA